MAQEKNGMRGRKEVSKGKKAFLYALGIGAASGAAYLTWDYVKRKKFQNEHADVQTDYPVATVNILPSSSSGGTSKVFSGQKDAFPLKKGSSGPRVIQLQQALAKIIGQEAMNANGGIDGKFGPGTENALRMAGYGQQISESVFHTLVGGSSLTVLFNPKEIANELYKASQTRNLQAVLSALSRIRSVGEYSEVNTHYKGIPNVSKTIVTDLLDFAFKTNEAARQQIRNEFLRIGLKMDATGKWSLSGLKLYKDIITLRDTFVTDSQYNRIPVRKNTILGEEVVNSNGMTWFKSVDKSVLQVPTQDVKYV